VGHDQGRWQHAVLKRYEHGRNVGGRAGCGRRVLASTALISVYTTPPPPAEEPPEAADDGGAGFAVPPAPAQLAPQPRPALTRADLPAPLRDLITRYEARSPGVHLVRPRLVTMGRPDKLRPRDGDRPSDAYLVSLTVTQTIVRQDQIEAANLVLLADRSGQVSA
jgi:hypothetical protein